jgi:hypothetical protein
VNNFSERATPEASAAKVGTTPEVMLSDLGADARMTMAGTRSLVNLR